MAINWDLYNKRLNINGATQRDRTINNFKSTKDKIGIDSPSSKIVSMERSDRSSYIDMQVFVNSRNKKNEKLISPVMSDDILILGNKVKWKNVNWIITELNVDDDVLIDGIIQQCNYTLPFQTNSSTIIQEPCIVEDITKYSTGEKDSKIITIPSTQKLVTIQYNTNTSKLYIGKRIFIDIVSEDAKVYKITDIDRLTKMQNGHGLWVLKCDEDAKNDEKDRPMLLIADYISKESTPVPDPNKLNCTIVYSGNLELKINGSSKTFTANFVDELGNPATAISPKWIITPSEVSSKLIIVNNGLSIKISAKDDSLLNQIFNLSVMDMYTGSTDSVNVKVVNLY